MRQRIAVLGSTGSIGVNTLSIAARLSDRFTITALSADSSIDLLANQARAFHPRVVSVGNASLASRIKNLVPGGIKVLYGQDALREIVSRSDVDIVVFAISGCSCLIPLMEAINKRKRIALANKESMVSAGPIIMKLARKNGVKIMPIDSEHSAIFQCIDGKAESPARIYLTGSGGPLLDMPKKKFDSVSRKFILKHPKWKMGKKISVDSATMMNKGLEIIEAQYLFGIGEEHIEVLIHPEAVVHSMVEFIDGSVLAQLAMPDMRLPIQYALTYPDRCESAVRKISFPAIGALSFRRPDMCKFPCLELARHAARTGSTMPAVVCASDEEAVAGYLDGRISFSDIPGIIEKVVSRHHCEAGELSLNDVLQAESWARKETRSLCYH